MLECIYKFLLRIFPRNSLSLSLSPEFRRLQLDQIEEARQWKPSKALNFELQTWSFETNNSATTSARLWPRFPEACVGSNLTSHVSQLSSRIAICDSQAPSLGSYVTGLRNVRRLNLYRAAASLCVGRWLFPISDCSSEQLEREYLQVLTAHANPRVSFNPNRLCRI